MELSFFYFGHLIIQLTCLCKLLSPKSRSRRRFSMKPMSVEEAALQMELLGHSFFVFTNDETEDMNVIYKRKDGNYGLIEAE